MHSVCPLIARKCAQTPFEKVTKEVYSSQTSRRFVRNVRPSIGAQSSWVGSLWETHSVCPLITRKRAQRTSFEKVTKGFYSSQTSAQTSRRFVRNIKWSLGEMCATDFSRPLDEKPF